MKTKKTYQAPLAEVVAMPLARIICGSDPDTYDEVSTKPSYANRRSIWGSDDSRSIWGSNESK